MARRPEAGGLLATWRSDVNPEITDRLQAIEDRMAAVEMQQTLIIAQLRALGEQVGLLLARLGDNLGG
jgi:hypothetical protein